MSLQAKLEKKNVDSMSIGSEYSDDDEVGLFFITIIKYDNILLTYTSYDLIYITEILMFYLINEVFKYKTVTYVNNYLYDYKLIKT